MGTTPGIASEQKWAYQPHLPDARSYCTCPFRGDLSLNFQVQCLITPVELTPSMTDASAYAVTDVPDRLRGFKIQARGC